MAKALFKAGLQDVLLKYSNPLTVVRVSQSTNRETTIFFQFVFQTLWKFPKSLEKFGKKFGKTFPKFCPSELLFKCHYIEYYISSTCRNPRDEFRGRNVHSTQRTTSKKTKSFSLFPKKIPNLFPNFFPKLRSTKFAAF